MKPLFNAVFYDGNSKLPNDKILYIITKKGTFLRKDLGTIRSCTKVDSISFLKEIEPYAELKVPQMPGSILSVGFVFLKWVYNTHKSEGGLLIYYNSTTKEYRIYAPTQEVSCGGVSWDNQKELIPKGFIRLGTIHSHANMSAFHSGTDINDEKSFDGLHITFGNLGKTRPTLVASVVANGNRFPVKKENIRRYLDIDVIEDVADEKDDTEISQSPIYENYQAWLDDRTGNVVRPDWKKWKRKKYTYKTYINENEMKFKISNVEPINFTFPNEWKSRVIKEQYTAGVYRLVGGKLVPVNDSKQIGFVPGGNSNYGDEDLLNDYYGCVPVPGDHGLPFGGHENKLLQNRPDYISDCDDDISKLPHMECIECMYRIIAQEALDQGLIDVDEDPEHDDKDQNAVNDARPTEEYYESFYGEHTEQIKHHEENVLFDDKGNIVDDKGNIIEKLYCDKEDQ